jgi:uncharacterized membrane protein YcaP (DUF421 family)
MELDWVWKAILIVLAGTVLLRFAGRKSISQMTLPQTVIMIGIGSLLIQPVADKNIWVTIGVGAMLVITLIGMEYAELKGSLFEKVLTGQSKVIIEKGIINETNLKKVRLTVDQLEANLRQRNVAKLADVEFATLEPNGQLGFVLKHEAQPVTKKEFQQLLDIIKETVTTNKDVTKLNDQLEQVKQELEKAKLQDTIFTEVANKGHDKQIPKHLQ